MSESRHRWLLCAHRSHYSLLGLACCMKHGNVIQAAYTLAITVYSYCHSTNHTAALTQDLSSSQGWDLLLPYKPLYSCLATSGQQHTPKLRTPLGTPATIRETQDWDNLHQEATCPSRQGFGHLYVVGLYSVCWIHNSAQRVGVLSPQ